MSRISLAVVAAGLFVVSSIQPAFAQEMGQHAPEPIEAGDALLVTLGRDSPNLGGNVFRDAFLSLTLSNSSGTAAGKVTSNISFPSSAGIAFDRAELTPDMEASGATVETEVSEGEDGTSSIKLTIAGGGSIPDGIIANLVFKVTKEFSLEEVGTEEHLITLDNSVSAWGTDDTEIAEALGEPGGIDLAYAPVVFACLFYMH